MLRRRKSLFFAVFFPLGIVAVWLLLTKPTSPDGLYTSSGGIGAVGDWYEEFANGKVTWVCHEDKKSTVRVDDGSYTKNKEGWVFLPDAKGSNTPGRIECRWYGLWVTSEDGHREFIRRRLFHGRRPDWMLDHLPWWVQ